MPYNDDAAWTRIQDLQREMENSRIWADRTADVLGLFARPIIAPVMSMPITFPASPVSALAMKQSLPAPDPRSITTSPSLIFANCVGSPQPNPRSASGL